MLPCRWKQSLVCKPYRFFRFHHHCWRTVHNTSKSQGLQNPQEQGSTRQVSDTLFGYLDLSALPGLGLTSPSDFRLIAKATIDECKKLRVDAITVPPSLQTIKLLDTMSDIICRATDTAELLRNVHSHNQWRASAQDVYNELAEYIEQLNTDPYIYSALCAVWSNNSLLSTFSKEQKRVTHYFKMEMEKKGIHLPSKQRAEVRFLESQLRQLETIFINNIHSTENFTSIPVKLVPNNIRTNFQKDPSNPSKIILPLNAHTTRALLKLSSSEDLRKIAYIGTYGDNTLTQKNLQVLDQLILTRNSLARLVGFSSFSHLELSFSLAQNPSHVSLFLSNLAKKLKPYAQNELINIASTKKSHQQQISKSYDVTNNEIVYDWDQEFYMNYLKSNVFDIDSSIISQYFSLSNCLEGINIVITNLFGVELVEVNLGPKENWVQLCSENQKHELLKFEIVDQDTKEVLGRIYLDLWSRHGKLAGGTTFNIKCGNQRKDGTGYTIPECAIVCSFSRNGTRNQKLLMHSDLETLFHEFGHAMHAILSRTEFQHMSGTRGAEMDFVEVPSTLFEYFVWDFRVLKLFARHHETNEVIPPKLLSRLVESKKMFIGLETLSSSLYAMLALELFSKQSTGKCTSDIYASIRKKYDVVPFTQGTHWQCMFSHLCHYGSSYYTYLYCRVFSSAIWHTMFESDPLSREAGERFRREVLVHGGAKDPNMIFSTLLGYEPLHGIQIATEKFIANDISKVSKTK